MKGLNRKSKTKFKNVDIAIIALVELGGITNFVHLEDVAMRSGRLSPSRFCWKKYPEQINIETVRISLKNELSPPNNRVTGGIKYGWMLTPSGISWCKKNIKFNEVINKDIAKKIEREIQFIKLSKAFQKYRKGTIKEISELELNSALRIDKYFSTRNRKERIMAFNNICCFDSELEKMIIALKKQGFTQLEVDNGRHNKSNEPRS